MTSIRIRIDPHPFSTRDPDLDPELHSPKTLDPDPESQCGTETLAAVLPWSTVSH
jgi:hypothetical protein